MINREDKLALFANEFNDIADANLRDFAKELIAGADGYFFTIAASTTGKYHPQFDLGPGGLVRHTRCVAYMAQCVATSCVFSQHDKDLITIAALAHDIKKLGDGKSKYTVGDHPLLARDYVLEKAKSFSNLISMEDAEKVAGAVASHMGIWGHEHDGTPMPKDNFEQSLQTADYIASRKEIIVFDFRPTADVKILTEDREEPKTKAFDGDPKDYVLQFGKHKGETLEQAEPSGYLDWMVKQDDFFNKEAQEIAKRYLESKKAPKAAPKTEPSVKANDSYDEIPDLPF